MPFNRATLTTRRISQRNSDRGENFATGGAEAPPLENVSTLTVTPVEGIGAILSTFRPVEHRDGVFTRISRENLRVPPRNELPAFRYLC